MRKPLIVETVISPKEETPQERTLKPSPAFTKKDNGIEIIGSSLEQCVIYTKRVTGIAKSIGYAGTARAEGQIPKVGAIALEASYGHAMVVENIRADGIIVTEANFIRGKITRRFVPFWDIRGYIY